MEEIIKKTQQVLKDNVEWENRYEKYVNEFPEKLKRTFREYPPLQYYISTSNVKKATKSLIVDVRYCGQSIATITSTKDKVTISTKNKVKNNEKHFKCSIELDDVKWNSEEAKEFRRFFKNGPNRNNDEKSNEEHNVEHLLLTEFSKRSGKDKQIKKIQPIKIGGMRYGMPTPISASNHKASPKYSRDSGGGIDILARTGRGKNTYLTIIEVKDENKKAEPPRAALEQATQYAVFIRELLRSKCGNRWYKIFGFKEPVPKKLTIRVACAMPVPDSNLIGTSFANKKYSIGKDDIIECHYIYFKYGSKQLSDFKTSLNKVI